MLYTYTTSILGMMCQKNCASTVHRAITSVKGVEHAVVTFATSDALVWIHPEDKEGGIVDPSLSIQQNIISEVEDVGYDIELLSTSIESSLQPQQHQQQPDRLPSNSFNSASIYKPLQLDTVLTSDIISLSKTIISSHCASTTTSSSISIAPAVTEYLFNITGTVHDSIAIAIACQSLVTSCVFVCVCIYVLLIILHHHHHHHHLNTSVSS